MITPEQQAEKVYADILAQMGKGGSAVQLQIIADAIRSAVAAEREACAKIAYDCEACDINKNWSQGEVIAAAIRARRT